MPPVRPWHGAQSFGGLRPSNGHTPRASFAIAQSTARQACRLRSQLICEVSMTVQDNFGPNAQWKPFPYTESFVRSVLSLAKAH